MTKRKGFSFRSYCAFLACPAFIVLHEWGFCGEKFGWGAKMHFAERDFDVPKEEFTLRRNVLLRVRSLHWDSLAAAGFLWLRTSARTALDCGDTGRWVATCLL